MAFASYVEVDPFQTRLKLLVYAVAQPNIMIIQGEDASIVLLSLRQMLMIQTAFVYQVIKNKMVNVYLYVQPNLVQIQSELVFVQMVRF